MDYIWPSVLNGRLFGHTVPYVEQEEIRSFDASWYKPRFDKRARQAYGIGRGVRPLTFVLARREWDGRWQDFAMSTISRALGERGLSRLSLLRWHRAAGGASVTWTCQVEADGIEAEQAWREQTLDDADWPIAWELSILMWSSEDGASKVLADITLTAS